MTSDPKKQDLERTKSEIDEIMRRVDALPVLDSRSEDEILGYDEHGLPN
jgi:antitoxin VapB